jgi:hypothetical protein
MATLKLRFLVWAERKAEIRTRCDQPCRAYLEDVPDLLAAIDELEVRNAKLEAVAVFMKKRGRKVSDCEAVKTTYVDRRPRFRYCGRCPMCKVWAALDALDD